ncbi:SGNH hydrolase domain-containing protein [Mycobacterium bohemicum]|uniref:SGNH hydrolase domain-containing protein n=1 Tax=Mycobacterium bohemicum TaxID=56425 RepID=UPI003D182630
MAAVAAEQGATVAAGGQYADLTDLFCVPDRCPVIVGNTLVFRDDNHVTTEYAQLMTPVMGALTDHAVANK